MENIQSVRFAIENFDTLLRVFNPALFNHFVNSRCIIGHTGNAITSDPYKIFFFHHQYYGGQYYGGPGKVYYYKLELKGLGDPNPMKFLRTTQNHFLSTKNTYGNWLSQEEAFTALANCDWADHPNFNLHLAMILTSLRPNGQ